MMIKTRRPGWFVATIIAALVAPAGAREASAPTGRMPSPPSHIAMATRCLVSADFVREDLRGLGLNLGETAAISYHIGSIPGMLATPGLMHIAVYAKDQQHGWLFLVDSDPKGGFVAVRNAYRLTRGANRWQADEGNGGLGTYEAVSRLATKLFSSRRYAVQLVPAKTGCSVE